MALTAAEQLLLELINRARLDPMTEARRFGIDLNFGLSPGQIGTAPQQVLAPNTILERAAENHSDWMLAQDVFSHTGTGGSSPGQRMGAAGYMFEGTWTWGENLASAGTTGALNLNTAVVQHYDGLFRSAGHRANTLNPDFREIGIAQVEGRFTSDGRTYNTSMLTEDFAASGRAVFVTGVAYRDTDGDAFYDIGEGRGDVWVASAGQRVTTAGAGGYGLAVQPTGGMTEVAVGRGDAELAQLLLDLSDGNAKLDLVTDAAGQAGLALSVSAELMAGVARAWLLGRADLDLSGSESGNTLTGNAGANRLSGNGGNDRLRGGDGADVLVGGADRDVLLGGNGNDRLAGDDGNDILTGGTGADVFVFAGGRDRITDFADNTDTILIQMADLGLGQQRQAAVTDMIEIRNGNAVLDLGDGDVLTLVGLRNAGLLADDLVVN